MVEPSPGESLLFISAQHCPVRVDIFSVWFTAESLVLTRVSCMGIHSMNSHPVNEEVSERRLDMEDEIGTRLQRTHGPVDETDKT